MIRLLLIIVCFPVSLAAQGAIAGAVTEALTGEAPEEPASVAVIVLHEQSPPFNEITAGAWQEALTAMRQRRVWETPFGGLAPAMAPEASYFTESDADGRFAFEGLPLESRLAVAAYVEGLWWPLAGEFWLTEEAPNGRADIRYYLIDREPDALVIRDYHLAADTRLRADLLYAPIFVNETLRLENSSSTHAALVEVRLDIAVPPGIEAAHLPMLYGDTQLMFMQGVNAAPYEIEGGGALAAQSWRFGGADFMHGRRAAYNRGPQRSADNWHPLNESGLAMIGAGDTLFVEDRSVGPRSAAVIFRRPVPPARDGVPGVLELRLRHEGGVRAEDPTGRVALSRRLPLPVLNATGRSDRYTRLQALVADSHRRLYGPGTTDGQGTNWPRHDEYPVSLPAGEEVQFVLALSPDAQDILRESAATAALPPPAPEDPDGRRRMRMRTVFQALSGFFGLLFLVALIATLRRPRDEQLKSLAQPPASREALIDALAEMEAAYKAGHIPARSYREQRQRLLRRLVDFDAGGSE